MYSICFYFCPFEFNLVYSKGRTINIGVFGERKYFFRKLLPVKIFVEIESSQSKNRLLKNRLLKVVVTKNCCTVATLPSLSNTSF